MKTPRRIKVITFPKNPDAHPACPGHPPPGMTVRLSDGSRFEFDPVRGRDGRPVTPYSSHLPWRMWAEGWPDGTRGHTQSVSAAALSKLTRPLDPVCLPVGYRGPIRVEKEKAPG